MNHGANKRVKRKDLSFEFLSNKGKEPDSAIADNDDPGGTVVVESCDKPVPVTRIMDLPTFPGTKKA